MKNKIPITVFLLSFLMICYELNAQCPINNPVIYFGNGILVSKLDALKNDLGDASPDGLKPKLKSRILERKADINFDCLKFDLAYNSTEGLKLDLLQAANQLIGEDTSKFWRWLSNLEVAPKAFQDFAANQAANNYSPSYVKDADLQKHIYQYNLELSAKNKVIVVPHSQGNLYANTAYNFIFGNPLTPSNNTFNIIPVATPSSYVAGQTPLYSYTTLFQDGVIKFVPGALNGNTSNLPDFDCGSPLSCHFFVDSYLKGPNSGNKILDQIIDSITFAPEAPFIQLTNTSFPVQNILPTISNDGSRVAFISNGNIGGLNSSLTKSLFVIRSDGTGLTKIGDNLLFDVMSFPASLSADGSRIAFIARTSTFDTATIYASNTDGTNLKKLTTEDVPASASLSGNGSVLVYSSFLDRYSNLKYFTINSDGTNNKLLVEFCCQNSGIGSLSPKISGDGSKVAFVFSRALVTPPVQDSTEFHLGVINTDGTNFVQISPSIGQLYSENISADGSVVAVASAFNPGKIFVANSTGANPRLLYLPFSPFIAAEPIQLTSDGSTIIFNSFGNIYLANTLNNSLKQLTFNFNSISQSIRGDGKKVVFVSLSNLTGQNPDLNLEVYLANIK